MAESFRILDLGDRRVLETDGRQYPTRYSARVIRMLVERKGPTRAPLYFDFKETRGRHFLGPLFAYLRAQRRQGLRVLEVGCSFGHMTEYLADQPEVATLTTFDTDPAFVELTRAKVEELELRTVREVRHLDQSATCRLPWPDAAFDLVVAVGVVEHLPVRYRRQQVDEYYRVLAGGGLLTVLDTPNRWFPLETHSVGLPLVQWLPPRLAYRYARIGNRRRYRSVSYEAFVADGTGWRNATFADCLPSTGADGVVDLTEQAGYGLRFFRATARSRTRRALLPLFGAAAAALRAAGRPPSLALPYLNLLFRLERGLDG
jgi:SAM-dependent methyltransferase